MITGFYDRKVLAFSNFEWTLKSGRKSPIYYNQRKLTSYDPNNNLDRLEQRRVRDLAIKAYAETVDIIPDLDHLYAMPQAMTALGGAIMHLSGESLLWGRVGTKSYGDSRRIEGDYRQGDRIVPLDDVITTAESKLEAAGLLEAHGLEVSTFVIMFDREEGGAEALEHNGYGLIAITGLTEAVEILKSNGRIGSRETEWMAAYHDELTRSQ